MKEISKARFDAYAGFSRSPVMTMLVGELAWFESDSGNVLALLLIDTDGEYSGPVFAPDLMDRYRCVGFTAFHTTPAAVVEELAVLMSTVESNLEERRVQGDETKPIDFFTPVVKKSRLNRTFLQLADSDGFAPARSLITLMMRWYENQDGNFVEQFQTTGFDARIWELYLFATLVESGYVVAQPSPAPDFLATGVGGRFYVEATTINPSVINGAEAPSQKPKTDDDVSDYEKNYLPMRFAGPLTAKLNKRYWEDPAVAAAPLLFAIQDFHDEMSMTYSEPSLARYLYALSGVEVETEAGFAIVNRTITHHRWKGKEIKSGFFNLPGAEHVSAVMFNGSGTLAKFNRLGISVGLGTDAVSLIHAGHRLSSDGTPVTETFSEEVKEGYEELWIDGLNVYHNPKALYPLDPDLLLGAAHHHLRDGEIYSRFPYGHLLSSRTGVVVRRQPSPRKSEA